MKTHPTTRDDRGQALVETAVVLPIMIVLFLGFLGAGVAAQGYVDLNTAVELAAAANATAYADDPVDADRFATTTFEATVSHDPLLRSQGLSCSGDYAAGGTITCRGAAVLEFSRTPLAVVVPFDPTITAQASAMRSPYRSARP